MGLYHYIGWPSTHDEWRPLTENISIYKCPQVTEGLNQRLLALKYHLMYSVKKALVVSSNTDPITKLQFTTDEDVFKSFMLEIGGKGHRHHVIDNNALNEALEMGWWWRIISRNQDFAYVKQGTLEVKLSKKSEVMEFVHTPGGLHEQHLQGPSTITISFVKKQGSHYHYDHEDWQTPEQVFMYSHFSLLFVCVN